MKKGSKNVRLRKYVENSKFFADKPLLRETLAKYFFGKGECSEYIEMDFSGNPRGLSKREKYTFLKMVGMIPNWKEKDVRLLRKTYSFLGGDVAMYGTSIDNPFCFLVDISDGIMIAFDFIMTLYIEPSRIMICNIMRIIPKEGGFEISENCEDIGKSLADAGLSEIAYYGSIPGSLIKLARRRKI
jgi:hypothetical protein